MKWPRFLAAGAVALAMSGVAKAETASPAPGFTRGKLLVQDDFTGGLGQWRTELENGGSVTARDGTLDIDVPGGCTVWLRPKLSGPVLIQYEATAVKAGGPNDRVSDVNCFWMAQDSRDPEDLFAVKRGGKFSEYDRLQCYYVGLGGNSNTTTRFRRYVGVEGNRPLRLEDDLSAPEYLLAANATQTIQLVAAVNFIAYYRNGRRIFSFVDDAPYTKGWFAFRTVASHLKIRDFRVYRLDAE
ncbi:MAG TPA: DUF6250 domain-containing protein [Opitutus sp.]|nr:DUF6250 domain-containing protein [Opitutus sp.]